MPYNPTTREVTAPVSIYDIQQVLGANNNSIGNLCTNSRVNMWAKYKPVRWANMDTRSALASGGTTWDPNAVDAWWKANDGGYGLGYPSVIIPYGTTNGLHDALNTLATYMDKSANGWEYLKPRGYYYNEHYRFADFIGYNHQAARPIRGGATYDVYARDSVSSQFEARVEYIETADTPVTTRNYIKPDDLMANGVTLYRGIVIYKRMGSGASAYYDAVAWCTGTKWVGGGIYDSESYHAYLNYVETLLGNHAAQGSPADFSYYIMPVYFTCDLTQPDVNQSKQVTSVGNRVITMPYVDIIGFEAIQTQRTIVLSNKTIASDYSFSTDIKVLNTATTLLNVPYTATLVTEEFVGTPSTSPSGTYLTPLIQGNVDLPQSNTPTFVCSLSKTIPSNMRNHIWSLYIELDIGTTERAIHNIGLIQPATPTV